MSLLEVQDLSKRFGGVVAVDSCSLSVPVGSITGLIGPNGSGKTTVFNLVTGFLPRDGGEVRFKSRSIAGLGPDRIYGLGIGRTFQLARIFPRLTALENMLVPVRRAGLRALLSHGQWGHEKARAMQMLEFMDISRVAGTLGGALSYGQRKLLELAAVMMAQPQVARKAPEQTAARPAAHHSLDAPFWDRTDVGTLLYLQRTAGNSAVASLMEAQRRPLRLQRCGGRA